MQNIPYNIVVYVCVIYRCKNVTQYKLIKICSTSISVTDIVCTYEHEKIKSSYFNNIIMLLGKCFSSTSMFK